jgi:aspartyl-tRNA(Asn)/glutamyl-tRNA(Gln) amidotransferase subunit A
VKSDTLYQRVEQSLQRIKIEHSPVFITVFEELKSAARQIEARCRDGTAGRLAGELIAVKDNIALQDQPLTCGSKILEGYISPYSATAVERIVAADGLIIGKTNLDEFAMGSSGEYSAFESVPNPWNSERVPGGSSSGSAAAVAAGLVDLALGSDTGGSVRQPAAFCGIVGLKPTYGLVSRYGLVSFAPSLDQIGILSKTVAENARLLMVIAGYDSADSTSATVQIPDYVGQLDEDVHGLQIGLPVEFFQIDMEPAVRGLLDRLVTFLTDSGCNIKEVSLPHTEYAMATYYILAMAEAASNLARFDGMRYGQRQTADSLDEVYTNTRTTGFGPEVIRRILLGTFVLSEGYYAAYYDKAQRVRRLIRNDYVDVFKRVDLLLCPVTPGAAFGFGEKTTDPLAMYSADIFTVPANLAGVPAISIPLGFDSDRMPVGGQLIGNFFQEETILRVGHYIERNFN